MYPVGLLGTRGCGRGHAVDVREALQQLSNNTAPKEGFLLLTLPAHYCQPVQNTGTYYYSDVARDVIPCVPDRGRKKASTDNDPLD